MHQGPTTVLSCVYTCTQEFMHSLTAVRVHSKHGALSKVASRDPVRQCLCGAFMATTVPRRRLLWTWGNADHGRLGHGENPNTNFFPRNQLLPRRVTSLGDARVRAVACGAAHTVLVTTAGQVAACGLGKQGQLGLGSTASMVGQTRWR